MKYIAILSLVLSLLGGPVFGQNNNTATYLALGDSVPFGMNVTLLPPYSSQPPAPAAFVGYPEIVTTAEHAVDVNASCPGETSATFLNSSAPDYGCNSPHIVPSPTAGFPPVTIPPFKTTYGLHSTYTGAQMDFAESQLQANKNISLVTLNIGANDVLLVLPQLELCGANAACAQNVLTPVLQSYAANLAQILLTIRAEYQGKFILMTYYSPAPALDSLTQAVNGVMTQVASQLSTQPGFTPITIADGYAAFQLASTFSNHDACQAGLLIQLPPSPYDSSPCDIHPSPLGRDLLAVTVEQAASLLAPCNASGGNLTIAKGQTCAVIGATVTGNITQTGGSLMAIGSAIRGNLQVRAGNFSVNSSVINGNLQVQNIPAGGGSSQICGTSVHGDVQIQDSVVAIVIGNPLGCAGNTVAGDVQVQNNTGAEQVAGNTVGGNLQVTNNTGPTQVFSNSVSKNLQCQNNTQLIVAGPNSARQKQGQCY